MKYPKVFAAGAAIFSLFFVSSGRLFTARAAEDCLISKEDLAAIKEIQSNPNLGFLEEINQELAARKEFLSKVITCAKNDTESLKSEVDGASVAAADKNLQGQLSGRIGDAINYYDIELEKLNNSGIKGSEQIAQEVLLWRGNNYAQLSANVDNFILWSKNQDLFQTASARMAQITPMVSFLSQAGNSDLESAFAAARMSFNAAEDENVSARNALAGSLPSDQTIAIIKQSLQSLSETYQNFFDVSNVIQKLLTNTSQN